MDPTTTLIRPGTAGATDAAFADAVYRKVGLRLIPLLFACYIAAYLDRVNVGFAKLQMQGALGLSDAVYGLGAGIFFIGYFLFEIPSNLILHRVGARRWIARIMVSWGILSAGTMFVRTPEGFYLLRFLLGIAEAGFFPGIVLYLTYWYPAGRRGRATSLFLTAVACAGIVGGPLSGWILHSLSGAQGLQGWQWLFLIEAVPSLVLGVAVWLWLDDRVSDAAWLTPAERALIAREVGAEDAAKQDERIARVLANPRVWLLALVYFTIVAGLYGVSFWLPTIIKAAGVSDPLDVGLVSAIPWAFGVVAMYLLARSADRRMERRWHTFAGCLVAAVGLELSVAYGGQVALSMTGLTLCAMGIMAALPVFWGNPTGFLGGTAAAAGIALINSVGNLAGFAAPFMIGWVKERTHSTDAGLHLLAALLVAGGFAVLALRRPAGTGTGGGAAR
jgi:D-galactonate transporter